MTDRDINMFCCMCMKIEILWLCCHSFKGVFLLHWSAVYLLLLIICFDKFSYADEHMAKNVGFYTNYIPHIILNSVIYFNIDFAIPHATCVCQLRQIEYAAAREQTRECMIKIIFYLIAQNCRKFCLCRMQICGHKINLS